MIYFITARDIGRVKIGYSANPLRRFSKVQTDSPTPLRLERVCDGTTTAEAALHVRFSEHRISGEWFALVPEIDAHMDTLPQPTRKPKGRRRSMLRDEHEGNPATAALHAEIKAFCAAHNMSGATFGQMALNDRPFLTQLRKGRRVWPETEAKVRSWMASYEAEAKAA